jgi:hypothetical protein
METSKNQQTKIFIQPKKETEMIAKRKFNFIEFAEALREESPKPTSKKRRTCFSFSEKILPKRHSDEESLSGCNKWRQSLDKGVRKDIFDEFFLSSTIVKPMKKDEIDEFFTSTISFKPAENRHEEIAAGFINKFTTSFAHILSKEYFDRTSFDDRRNYHCITLF